jgi:hypothetical protein
MKFNMERKARIPLLLLCLPTLLLACTLGTLSFSTSTPISTSTPASTPTSALPVLTVSGILKDYATYQDQLVSVQGYGVVEAMMPLCEGYVGMDMRTVFVDKEGNSITASLAGNLWEAMKGDKIRDFLGYVRVFNGDLGCPGSVANSTFPYFEIVEVK